METEINPTTVETSVKRNKESISGREKILNAALRLSSDSPFETIALREIARTAGVSLALIRHHFNSKDELKKELDRLIVEKVRSIWGDTSEEHARNMFSSEWSISEIWADSAKRYVPYLRQMLNEESAEATEIIQIFDMRAKQITAEISKNKLKEVPIEELELFVFTTTLAPIMASKVMLKQKGVDLFSIDAIAGRANIYQHLFVKGITERS